MKEVVKCHGTSEGESWSIELFDGDKLIASAHGFSSAWAAREAGDYLRAGVVANWRLSRAASDAEVSAGVAAYRDDEELERACADEVEDDGVEVDDTGIIRRRVRAILNSASQAWACNVVTTQIKCLHS